MCVCERDFFNNIKYTYTINRKIARAYPTPLNIAISELSFMLLAVTLTRYQSVEIASISGTYATVLYQFVLTRVFYLHAQAHTFDKKFGGMYWNQEKEMQQQPFNTSTVCVYARNSHTHTTNAMIPDSSEQACDKCAWPSMLVITIAKNNLNASQFDWIKYEIIFCFVVFAKSEHKKQFADCGFWLILLWNLTAINQTVLIGNNYLEKCCVWFDGFPTSNANHCTVYQNISMSNYITSLCQMLRLLYAT